MLLMLIGSRLFASPVPLTHGYQRKHLRVNRLDWLTANISHCTLSVSAMVSEPDTHAI